MRKVMPFVNAVLAALAYGGWAVYANYEHGVHAWAMAGVIQGVYAFISTLTVTHIAQWCFFTFGANKRAVFTGFIASFIVMACIPISVHSVAGTPDILETIAPGLIWGSFYLLGILVLLYLKESNALPPWLKRGKINKHLKM